MLEKLGTYRAALWLAIAIALINVVGWSAIVVLHYSRSTEGFVALSAVYVAIPVGLWMASNLIRYLGAVCLIIFAGGLIWPLVSSGAVPFINRPAQSILLFAFFIVSAALNVLMAGILLLSKKFAADFAYERKHQPQYKTYLKWTVVATAIAAMLWATFVDILNLTSN
jgi:hypothetical protein